MGLPPTPYEVSEFYSYRVQVKLEGQDWKGTLAMMESLKDKVCGDTRCMFRDFPETQ